jgi:hypothetical protein
MGSSVIIVIKHDRQRTYCTDLIQKLNREMNISHHVPKLFDGSNPLDAEIKYNRRTDLHKAGILVSNYLDNEFTSRLIVNHDMMFSASELGQFGDKLIADEKDFIRSITRQVKQRHYPFSSYLKTRPLSLETSVPSPVKSGDSPMSIFCIQTDEYSSNKFHDHFKNILAFVETGVLLPSTFGQMRFNDNTNSIIQYGDHVQYIGTLDSQTAAILSLRYGNIDMTRIPNRKIELLNSSDLSNRSYCSMSVATSFMKSLGLVFSPVKKHELDNQP